MSSESRETTGGGQTSGAMTPKGFRMDIQGLRGLALILVLLTHAEIPAATGGFVGLDIFYVLSGFLITGLIVTEVERKGKLSLKNFYARRAKRLLPLAVTVLGVIVIGSALLFSPLRSQEVSGDVLAAALYMVNWRFISQEIDYFAFDVGASPVQHYWSLAVEEQFYFLWPLLVVAAVVFAGSRVAQRYGLGIRQALGILIVPLFTASLAYSVYIAEANPHAAYFSTPARVWELAAGALLMLVLPLGIKLPRWVAAAAAAGGLIVLIGSMFAFEEGTPYPGWRALLPVGAGLAIIVAGTATVSSLPTRMLCWGPIQYVGKISYSWYLWHWPAIVFALALWGELSTPALTAVTLASAVPAIVTHYAIEERFRRSRTLGVRPRRALALGATCTVAAVFLGFGLQWTQSTVPTASRAAALGAQAVGPSSIAQQAAVAVRPSPREAQHQKGRLFDDGCVLLHNQTVSGECAYGWKESDKTVVVFGDSHALEWFPPMLDLARKHRWRLVGLARAGCVVGQVTFERPCNVWRRNSMRRIIRREQADMVVISNSTGRRYQLVRGGKRLSRRASQPHLIAGFAKTLRRLKRSGAKVAVIRDQPLAPFNPPDCVSRHINNLDRCVFQANRPRSRAFDAFGTARVRGVNLIDPIRVLCPRKRRCRSVVGNVLVYRDTYHITPTYARTLTPWLERQLRLPNHLKRAPGS